MIALPSTPTIVLEQVINPELEQMPMSLRTNAARIAELAIAIQETNLAHREQVHGPAHSLWQFERNGIIAVMNHPAVGAAADDACERHGVPFEVEPVYQALEHDDGLGAAFARLLLRSDPYNLPTDEDGVWEVYIRCWRPGKPDRSRWSRAFAAAEGAVL